MENLKDKIHETINLYKSQILKYLKSRGLDSNTIESFDIGYAGDGWDHLLSVIIAK